MVDEPKKQDAVGDTAVSAQVDALCDQFEAAWKGGKLPRIEDYLEKVPNAERGALLHELVRIELTYRLRDYQQPRREQYQRRFPDWPQQIEAAFGSMPAGLGTEDATVTHAGASTSTREQQISCPACRRPIQGKRSGVLGELKCSGCGLVFRFVGGETITPRASLSSTGETRRRVGHFELIEHLGAGAFGSVWKARDTKLERTVAIKIPRHGQLSEEEVSQFLREARAAAQLRHPNIVSVHDVGLEGGVVYIVSDFIEGRTLDCWLSDECPHAQAAAELGKKIALALHHAHQEGVVHRDLKPSNIMIDRSGEPHIMDFGLAKRESEEITLSADGQILGTPAYMSPEQARGEGHTADRRSDVYSLGVILFEMLTGQRPFSGNLRMLLKQVLEDEPPRPRKLDSQIPPDLETICLKCLEKESDHRYRSSREVADELRRFLDGEAIEARPIGHIAHLWRWCRRNSTVAWLAVSSMVLLFVLALIGARAYLLHLNRLELEGLTRQFEARLTAPGPWNEDRLAGLEGLLDEIAPLDADEADLLRPKPFEHYADHVDDALATDRFSEADYEAFQEQLDVLRSHRARAPETIAGLVKTLQDRAQERLRQLSTVLRLTPPFIPPIAPVFEDAAAIKSQGDGDGYLSRVAGSGPRYDTLLTRESCPPGGIELKAVFGPDWTAAAVVGLALNVSADRRYDFWLTVPEFDARDVSPEELKVLPSFEKVIARLDNHLLKAVIMRDGEPLREMLVEVPRGPLTVSAKREGSTLTMVVDDVHTVKFEDLFPISSKRPGKFGVYWPQEVPLQELQAFQRRAPVRGSQIEQADRLFSEGEYGDALRAYEDLNTTEAKFKIVLCADLTDDWRRRDKTLAELVELPLTGKDVDEEEEQWRLLARIRALETKVQQREWNDVRDLLDELSRTHDFRRVALLIPVVQRERILQFARKPGQRSRVASTSDFDTDDLERAVYLESILNEDASQRRMTRWRLADAYRVANQRARALDILRELIEPNGVAERDAKMAVPVRERIALLSDLAWVLIVEGRLDEALAALNHWIESGPGPEYLPLLVARARVYMNQQRWQDAQTDLERFFKEVPRDRLAFAEYADACALLGLIYADQAKEEEAKRTWRQGLLRDCPPDQRPGDAAHLSGLEMIHWSHALYWNGVLASWTGELTEDEAQQQLLDHIPGLGISSTTLRRLMKTVFEKSLLQRVTLGAYQSQHGRRVARKAALRQYTLREYYLEPMSLMLYQGVLETAAVDIKMTSELDELLYRGCRYAVEAFAVGKITDDEIGELLRLWTGRGDLDRTRWKEPLAHFEPEMVAAITFLFAQKYRLDGELSTAAFLYREVLQDTNAPAEVVKLAREKLQGISKEGTDEGAGRTPDG